MAFARRPPAVRVLLGRRDPFLAADRRYLKSEDLTFTRGAPSTGGIATAQIGLNAVKEYAADVLRQWRVGDGDGFWNLIEAQLTNGLADSNDNWAKVTVSSPAPTVTDDALISPTGVQNASQVELNASTSTLNTGNIVGHAYDIKTGVLIMHTWWARLVSGGPGYRSRTLVSGVSWNQNEIAAENVGWTRRAATLSQGAANITLRQDALCTFNWSGSPGALPAVVLGGWGHQVEDGTTYPRELVITSGGTSQKAPDLLVGTPAQVAASMLTQPGRMQVKLQWASADIFTVGTERWLWSFDGNANGVRMRRDATGLLWEVVQAGAVRAASQYFTTAGRRQALEVFWNPGTGRVGLLGATTGNGLGSAGSPWTWAAPSSGVRIGGVYGAAAGSGLELDGGYRDPEAWDGISGPS